MSEKLTAEDIMALLREYRETRTCPICHGRGRTLETDRHTSWSQVCTLCRGEKEVTFKLSFQFEKA